MALLGVLSRPFPAGHLLREASLICPLPPQSCLVFGTIEITLIVYSCGHVFPRSKAETLSVPLARRHINIKHSEPIARLREFVAWDFGQRMPLLSLSGLICKIESIQVSTLRDIIEDERYDLEQSQGIQGELN